MLKIGMSVKSKLQYLQKEWEKITSLAESCRRILCEKSCLSTAIPGFMARAPQSDLATAIAHAIEEKTTLVAEAGTGTGKTFAYLLPCLLSEKKALISTATKTLAGSALPKGFANLDQCLRFI